MRLARRTSLAVLAAALVSVACSTSRDLPLQPDVGDAPPPLSLVDGDDSADASTSGGGACPSNVCPAGRTSCPNNPYPCSVDLSSDDENCGACGVTCLQGKTWSNHTMRCIAGACHLLCAPGFADCNGLLDDGCEVFLDGDTQNCGACGKVCDVCKLGRCGCPTGQTLCDDGECHALKVDDNNCNACGTSCLPDMQDLTDPLPEEWNAYRGCLKGACGKRKCAQSDGIQLFGDCNEDLLDDDGDGCETLLLFDPKNCGACGSECAPGEECAFGKCSCYCGSICFTAIDTDIDNCGTCGNRCPGNRASTLPTFVVLDLDPAHGKPLCDQGVCGYECSRGFGNCDGDLENGCEAHLFDDPLNCGGCGIRCDGTEGQACIDGKCLMKDCEVK